MKKFKNERGGVKLITLISILLIIMLMLFGFVAYKHYFEKESNTNNNAQSLELKNSSTKEIRTLNKTFEFKIQEADSNEENLAVTSYIMFKDDSSVQYYTGNGANYYGTYSIEDSTIICNFTKLDSEPSGEYEKKVGEELKFKIINDDTLRVSSSTISYIKTGWIYEFEKNIKNKGEDSLNDIEGYTDNLTDAHNGKVAFSKLVENNELLKEEEDISKDATELSIDDKIINEIRERIDLGKIGVLEETYKYGAFNLETISNDLVLDIAWNKLEREIYQNFEGKDNEHIKNVGKENATFTVTKEEMKTSIESIFGKKVKYTDKDFKNPYPKTFFVAKCTSEDVKYENGKYTASFAEGGGAEYPYISESIEKAIKHDDKIEIYVKTSFVTALLEDEQGKHTREYYADFDFDKNQFVNKIDVEDKNQQHTYLYTYQLDESTGNYHLYGFRRLSK